MSRCSIPIQRQLLLLQSPHHWFPVQLPLIQQLVWVCSPLHLLVRELVRELSCTCTLSTIAHSQYNIQILFILDVQYVSEAYRIDFEDLKSEYVQLFIDVAKIIEKNNKRVTKKKLKEFLSRFDELRASLASADTIIDLLDIIRDHSSFTCCSRLQHVARYFKITAATEKIESYLKFVEQFCSQKLSKHFYMKPFVTGKRTEITPSTTITFKLEWRPGEKTLSNIQSVLRQAFNYYCINVHIVVVRGGSVRVLCYSPQHVMKHLVRLAQVNKEVLVESGVCTKSTRPMQFTQH